MLYVLEVSHKMDLMDVTSFIEQKVSQIFVSSYYQKHFHTNVPFDFLFFIHLPHI